MPRQGAQLRRIALAAAARAAWVLLLLTLLLLTLPTLLNTPAIDVDSQWETAMQVAAHQHMQWGTQVIWTYGPLGYLQYPMLVYSAEWRVSVVVLAVVSLAFVGSIALLLRARRAGILWLLLTVAVFAATRGIASGLEVKLAVCMVVLTALAVEDRVGSRVALACASLAGLSFALGFMVRGTELLVAALSVPGVCVTLLIARRRRTAAVFAGSFVVGGLAIWLVAGQSLGSIPAYLRSAWEIGSGYSSLATSAPSAGDLAVSLLTLVPFAILAVVAVRRRSAALGATLVPCAAWALVTYKEGISDGGPHRLIEAVTLIAVLVMVAIAGATRFPSVVSAVACAGAAFAWLFLSPSVALGTGDWNTAPPGDGSPAALVSAYRDYTSLFFSATDRTRLLLAEQQGIRARPACRPTSSRRCAAAPRCSSPSTPGAPGHTTSAGCPARFSSRTARTPHGCRTPTRRR